MAKWLKLYSIQYDREITAELAKMYQAGLGDMEPEQIEEACKKALLELKFFPKIAEIRERVGNETKALTEIQAEEDWAFAWTHAPLDYNPDLKTGLQPRGLSPAGTWAILRMGGWPRIAEAKERDEPFMRKRFMELYELYGHSEQAKRITAGQSQRTLPAESVITKLIEAK